MRFCAQSNSQPFIFVLVDLATVLTPEIMAPILANAEVQERLMPYLPSGESLPQTAEEIQNTLTSPQFQQVDALQSREEQFSFLPPLRVMIRLALLFQVPASAQSRNLLCISGKERCDLMEH